MHQNTVQTKFTCKVDGCNSVFSKLSRLNVHTRVHLNERPYKCDHNGCDKAYTNSSHLNRHLLTHNTKLKRTYECHRCSMIFSTMCNLKRHYNRAHKSDNAKKFCEECNVSFRKKELFQEHMSFHAGLPPHQCNTCKKNFSTLRQLKRHETSHEPKTYQCSEPQCSEVFEKLELLFAHRKTHIKVCEVCNRTFELQYRFERHRQRHSNQKPIFPCPYTTCNRIYDFKRNLDQHIRVQHMGKKYECDLCKTKYASKFRLTVHITKQECSEGKPKEKSKKSKEIKTVRRKRKDAGIPRGVKKSAISTLIGLDLPDNVEKMLKERKVVMYKTSESEDEFSDQLSNDESELNENNEGETKMDVCDMVTIMQVNSPNSNSGF